MAFLRVKKSILFNALLFNFQSSLLLLYLKKKYIYDGMSHLLLPLILHGFSLALLEHENYSISLHSWDIIFALPVPPPLNQCHHRFSVL